MKLDETTKILGTVAIMFPNFALKPEQIKAWHEWFKHVSAENFSKAFTQAAMADGQKFFPTPGEVMTQLRKIVYGAKLTAEEAFKIAFQHVVSNKPNFKQLSDLPEGKAILDSIDIVGREGIFNDGLTIDPFTRKDFTKVYCSLLERDIEAEKSELLGLLTQSERKLIN